MLTAEEECKETTGANIWHPALTCLFLSSFTDRDKKNVVLKMQVFSPVNCLHFGVGLLLRHSCERVYVQRFGQLSVLRFHS